MLIDDAIADGECPACLLKSALHGETPESGHRSAPSHAVPSVHELNELLDAYEVTEFIGQGGMGAVYRARQVKLDREVAIKFLLDSTSQVAETVERFLREAKTLARLRHPNIVTAIDADDVNDMPYLVMEFVPGTDFSALVKQHGPVSIEQAIDWILQAARGLEYAHDNGVVHRDIKPSNLLVDESGQLRILDLGLARFESIDRDGEQVSLTDPGRFMGTADFMSPEQAADSRAADFRSDIYSLGCTLFYLLTGRSLYIGETVVKKILAHRDDAIPSLAKLLSHAPPLLDDVFQRMVAKNPDDRQQSMTQVIQELSSIQGRASTTESPQAVSLMDRHPEDQTLVMDDVPASTQVYVNSEEELEEGERSRKADRGRRTLRFTTIGVGVVLLAGTGYLLSQQFWTANDNPLREQSLETESLATESLARTAPRKSQAIDKQPGPQHPVKIAAIPRDKIRMVRGQVGVGTSVNTVLVDVDRDGDLDILCGNREQGPGMLDVWLNDGTAKFERSHSTKTEHPIRSVTVGDVDKDGDQDAIVCFYLPNQPARLLKNNGAGRFMDADETIGTGESFTIVMADFDGDGHKDVFAGRAGANELWKNDGTGKFSDSGARLGVGDSLAVAAGDLDRDGDIDVVVVNSRNSLKDSEYNRVWFNDGQGRMSEHQRNLSDLAQCVELADPDADGDLDAVIGNRVWKNDGHGALDRDQHSLPGPKCEAVVISDWDHDGFPDVLGTNRFAGAQQIQLLIWWNEAGRCRDNVLEFKGPGARGISVGDLDEDGDLDVVLASESGGNEVWLNLTPAQSERRE